MKVVSAVIIVALVVEAGIHHNWIAFGIGAVIISVAAIGSSGKLVKGRRSKSH
jgi:hypothetical protein